MNDAIRKIISPHRMRTMVGDQKMHIPADRMEGIVNDIVNAIAEAVGKEETNPNLPHNPGSYDVEMAGFNRGVRWATEIIRSFKKEEDERTGTDKEA